MALPETSIVFGALLDPLMQFVFMFQLAFAGFLAFILFLIVRLAMRKAKLDFATTLSAAVGLVAFLYIWTNFIPIFIASLGITGIGVLIFYLLGIPLSAFVSLVLILLDKD